MTLDRPPGRAVGFGSSAIQPLSNSFRRSLSQPQAKTAADDSPAATAPMGTTQIFSASVYLTFHLAGKIETEGRLATDNHY
jgi:hypothetical protein